MSERVCGGCGGELTAEDLEYLSEVAGSADRHGMECLMEHEQAALEKRLCGPCVEALP